MSSRLAAGGRRRRRSRYRRHGRAADRRPGADGELTAGSATRRRLEGGARAGGDGELNAQRDAPVGGQAVLEGVMMRGVSNWAVAVRKPTAEQLSEGERSPGGGGARRDRGQHLPAHLGAEAPPRAAPADRARSRGARRIAGDRLPCARGLGQRAAAAREEEEEGAEEIARASGPGPWSSRCSLAIVLFFLIPRRPDEPDQGPAGLLGAVLAGRGHRAHEHLPRLHAAALAHARPAARVRVPRRRAQDDLLLRGRPAADARQLPSASRGCTRAAARASCWS